MKMERKAKCPNCGKSVTMRRAKLAADTFGGYCTKCDLRLVGKSAHGKWTVQRCAIQGVI